MYRAKVILAAILALLWAAFMCHVQGDAGVRGKPALSATLARRRDATSYEGWVNESTGEFFSQLEHEFALDVEFEADPERPSSSEISVYLEYFPLPPPSDSSCSPPSLSSLYKNHSKGTLHKCPSFLRSLYAPLIWDVFWTRTITSVETKLNLNRATCSLHILNSLSSHDLKLGCSKIVACVSQGGQNDSEVRMTSLAQRISEGLNLSTHNMVRAFAWAAVAEGVVKDMTCKMESKTLGNIKAWDGREWRR